jgi:hypothetical protein
MRDYFLKAGYDVFDSGLESLQDRDEWLRLRNCNTEDCLRQRLKPDFLLTKGDKGWFVEVKGWTKNLSLLQLYFNVQRDIRTIYVLDSELAIFDSALASIPEKHMRNPAYWNAQRKPYPSDLISKIIDMIAPLELQITNDSRIGDPYCQIKLGMWKPLDHFMEDLSSSSVDTTSAHAVNMKPLSDVEAIT